MPIDLPKWMLNIIDNDPEKFMPYAGHIKPDVVALMDGSVMGIVHVHGTPFELTDPEVRNSRASRINNMLRQLYSPEITVAIHMVRHHGITDPPQPKPRGEFVSSLARDYNNLLFAPDTTYRNDWFITVIIHAPKKIGKAKNLANYARFWKKRRLIVDRDPDREQTLEDAIRLITSTLQEYEPRRLGLVDYPTEFTDMMVPITEVGSALYLMRTAIATPIPHTTGPLASAIYTNPVVFGPKAFDLEIPGTPRVGSIISFQNYPAKPRVGMFNSLLSAPYPCVLSNIMRFKNSGDMISKMRLIRQQMANAGDAAGDINKGLANAENDIASLRAVGVVHQFYTAVYAKDVKSLDSNVAHALTCISRIGGAAPTRELNVWYAGGMESAYYLQMPGCDIFKPRPGSISTRDFACMASLDNYPIGQRESYWGPSIIRLKTNGLTTYDLATHVEDVGHCMMIGGTGKGKTVLLGTTAAFLEPVMGKDGIRIIIDKDEGNRLLVEEAGGKYARLRRNRPSGLAPLKAFSDSPETRSFFMRLYSGLITRGRERSMLTQDEEARLARGIACQLRMPPAKRSMSGVREFLGYTDREDGAGAIFEKYCRGNTRGWLLDNDEHIIDIGAGLYGFDFTDLIPKEDEGETDDGSCGIAANVITYQLSNLMDGRKIICFFDECRFYIEPLKRMIDDMALTGRKKELACWLIAQQPEHFTESTNGMSLVQQMRTKIVFPDASHNIENLKKVGLSLPAVAQLKGDMTVGGNRQVLIWREHAEAICNFNLTGLPQLPLFSVRSGTIQMMNEARKATQDPEQARQDFYRRLAAASAERKKAA